MKHKQMMYEWKRKKNSNDNRNVHQIHTIMYFDMFI